MWAITTSDGRRVADIHSETDARRIVHALGITQLRGPYVLGRCRQPRALVRR
jgi:hypothetical protein